MRQIGPEPGRVAALPALEGIGPLGPALIILMRYPVPMRAVRLLLT